MISRIAVWHRGQAIPLRLFDTSDTAHRHTRVQSCRDNSQRVIWFPLLRPQTAHTMPAMPIRHYLQGHRFDAETVRLMGIAYETALVALLQRRREDPLREAAAHKIIELAEAGERDPERLCEGALKAIQPMAPVLISDPSPLPPHASPQEPLGS
jgi:hypothetical protein